MTRKLRARRRRRMSPLIAGRLERIRGEIKQADFSALLVTDRVDQIYLTGFTGEDGAVLITQKDVYLLSDGRFENSHKLEAPWAKLIKRKLTVADELGPLVKKLRVRKVGFQADNLPVATANTFRKVVRPARLLVEPGLVAKMRLFKQADELRRIRKAVDVAQQAFHKMLRSIRPGQTELDLAARLEFEMKKRGSQRPSFDSIVAEGPNAALPHAVPGKRKVRSGSVLLFDWGAQVDWYCSDITRMAFVDRIPPRLSRIYDIVLEAQVKAIEAVAPGAELAAVDAVARKHIKRAGYGKYFGHGLGHGLGMYVHEAPSVRWSSTGQLEPGMVVTIEPGIYLPGVGGVRIEDDVLVTGRGHQVLTTLSKDREAAVI